MKQERSFLKKRTKKLLSALQQQRGGDSGVSKTGKKFFCFFLFTKRSASLACA
jgi:hypothetical protein